MRSLLIRGMLVGLVAALPALLCAWLLGEPPLGDAIAFEERHAHVAEGAHDHPVEVVSRLTQQTVGLAVALAGVGIAIGGLFAVAFATAYGRIGRFDARATALLLAVGGFLTVTVVPFLKYPANPPTVGNPETIDQRTALYFAMVAIALVALTVALQTGRRLVPRVGNWNASLLGGGVFLLLVAVAYLLLPGSGISADGFPADTLWHFRIASLATQAVLWAALGLVFGVVAERSVGHAERKPLKELAPDSLGA